MTNQKESMQSGLLNLAALHVGTQALGPGWRAGLWVQGCEMACPGCIAPEWQVQKPVFLASPEALTERILADPNITGLTISGGEPFLQAAGLAAVARMVRSRRSLDVICYTGYTMGELETLPNQRAIQALIGCTDVVIDGRYLESLNDGQGLRGSDNQVVHYTSDHLMGCDFEQHERSVEVVVQSDGVLVVGLPPAGFGLDLEVSLADREWSG
jgi:anaerobic ribonucleoside-triphosphate reductase activating protein